MSAQIKRNDPCHCDNGKKYKNCHGKEGSRKSYPWSLWAAILVLIVVFSLIPDKPQSKNNLASKPYIPKDINSKNRTNSKAPPGKVWSVEHGHWHDIKDGANISQFNIPNSKGKVDAPEATSSGKTWSKEHGHWHGENEK